MIEDLINPNSQCYEAPLALRMSTNVYSERNSPEFYIKDAAQPGFGKIQLRLTPIYPRLGFTTAWPM